MRIVAFSLVVLGHRFSEQLTSLSSDGSVHITLRLFYGALREASAGGAMGVVVFFLVSGYIITHVLQKESTLEFYIKRIFRIYPLYIAAVVAEIFVRYVSTHEIPPLSVIIPRLLLIGDFFNTPLALVGVEWTLRIEILFYVFMGALKKTGLIRKGNALTTVLLLSSVAIAIAKPFPDADDFNRGYFTLYSHFLFIGVVVYLMEKKMANKTLSILAICMMFYLHLSLTEQISKQWSQHNYAIIGLFIFILSWALRDFISSNRFCTILSDITYAVYLLHQGIWGILSSIANKIGIPYINKDILIVLFLFTISYIAHITIERWGVLAGKKIYESVRRIRNDSDKKSSLKQVKDMV